MLDNGYAIPYEGNTKENFDTMKAKMDEIRRV
jgi:hypothetical protein